MCQETIAEHQRIFSEVWLFLSRLFRFACLEQEPLELTEAKGSWSEATSKNGVGKRSSEVGMAPPFDESTSRITYTVCGWWFCRIRSVSVSGGNHAIKVHHLCSSNIDKHRVFRIDHAPSPSALVLLYHEKNMTHHETGPVNDLVCCIASLEDQESAQQQKRICHLGVLKSTQQEQGTQMGQSGAQGPKRL